MVALVAATLAVTILAGGVASGEKAGGFVVTGRVYCDLCRAGFETNVSKSVAGATVKVACWHFGANKETLKAKATTDDYGWYKLEIDQDRQEEICEVVQKQSPDPATAPASRSPPTTASSSRASAYANPIAFFRKDPLKECACGTLLQKYDLKDASEMP